MKVIVFLRSGAALAMLLLFYFPADFPAMTPTCGGIDDTVAIRTMISSFGSNTGRIELPVSATAQCAVNNLTVPSNVTLDNTAGPGIKVNTGQTLTIQGPLVGPPKPFFLNATAGLGTVSFKGNKVLREVYPEWWGGGAGVAATTNTAAFVAANAALVTNNLVGYGNGDIVMGPGEYLLNGFGVTLGSGPFTGIGLRGTNGLVGTKITYSGTGDAITIMFGRFNKIQDFQLSKSGSRGTSRGIVLTGTGGAGAYTFWSELDRLFVTGFHIGIENGNTINGIDADSITYKHVVFEQNDIGLKVTGFNSTSANLYDCVFESNSRYGIFTNIGGASRNFNIHGGSFGRNGKGIYITGAGNWEIIGTQDELPPADPDYQFILAESDFATIHLDGFVIGAKVPLLNYPLISVNAKSTVVIENSDFHYLSTHAIPFGPSTPNAQVAGSSTLVMRGNKVNENAALFSSNANMAGFTYTLEHNRKYDDTGAYSGNWDDEAGIIGTGGTRIPIRTVGGPYTARLQNLKQVAALTFAQTTPAQIKSNQNNYNPGATTYTLRLATDASHNLTGLTFPTAQQEGQSHLIINVGSFNIVLTNQDAASTAANRFLNPTGADITLTPNQQALLLYDGTTARWRVSKMN